jgi:hypothetical protein
MAQFDIEEILFEAHALGIRKEVIRAAGHLMDNNTFYDISIAYDLAYQYCVKQIEQNETDYNAADSVSCV